MRWLAQSRMQIEMLFGRKKAESRLNAELRDHLERQIAENIAAGMNAEEARYAALRMFGNPALLREQAQAAWSWNGLELLARDARHSVRMLRRSPGFASIAILVIALGVGANVALFAIVRSVLLNPLPYADSGHLLRLYENISVGGLSVPYGDSAGGMYTEWKEHNRTLADMAIVGSTDYNLSSAGELPEVVHAGNYSWNMLSLLGVRPFWAPQTCSSGHRSTRRKDPP